MVGGRRTRGGREMSGLAKFGEEDGGYQNKVVGPDHPFRRFACGEGIMQRTKGCAQIEPYLPQKQQ